MNRRGIRLGAAILVVLVGLAGTVYAISNGRPTKNAAVTTTPSPGPAHGSLIYEAKLSPSAWSTGGAPSPNPAGSATVTYGTSIDLKIQKDGAGLSGEFDGPALKNYVADLVLRVDQGSDFEVNWLVRNRSGSEHADVGLNIQVADETMTLYLSPDGASNQALAATVPVTGMQNGRTINLVMVVNGQSIALYLDGRRVVDVTESSATGGTTPSFEMDGKSGALHILSLRYYAIA